MIYYDVKQRSDKWFDLRLGKFTASTFKDLMANTSTQAYKKEINRVVFERLTGKLTERFEPTAYMQRGNELEGAARDAYMAEMLCVVEEPGFFASDDGWVGCSPDGLMGSDGLLEIKCPGFNNMIEYLKAGKLPTLYRYQVQGQLWVTGREYCDFVAFHPDLPLLNVRVEREDAVILALEQVVKDAKKRVLETIKKIQS